MGLEQLPTELLWLILERSYSPADLHSTFCASPVLLRAYLAARERILASVLAGVILPAAQRHAIAIAKVPIAPKEEQLADLWKFLDDYFEDEKCDTPTVFPSDRLTLMNLMWLHAQVEVFVEDYYEDAKQQFVEFCSQQSDTTPSKSAPKFASLSRTEVARLQRAFYRYEVYSRCFGVSAWEKWVSHSPVEEHHDHFLGRLEPWQVEEMCCIHQFLMARVASVVERMQNEMVATVLSHQVESSGHSSVEDSSDNPLVPSEPSLALSNSSPSLSGQNIIHEQEHLRGVTKESALEDDDICEYEGSDDSELRLFSSRERIWFYHWISDVTSFGLMYIKGFLDSPPDSQRDVFLRNASRHRTFLPHVLINVDFDARRETLRQEDGTVSLPRRRIDEDVVIRYGDNLEDLSYPNLGYLLYKEGPSYPTIPFVDNNYWHLRRLGYVFWDSSRVLEPNFRDCLFDARETTDREFDSTKKPSAEDILQGVKLPRRVMQDIRERYGIWPFERE